MIQIGGKTWGTAAEIAAALGPDIRPATVRRWETRDGLPAHRGKDDTGRPQVLFPLAEAARIEAAKRLSRRGRPRQLDTTPPDT